MSYCKIYSQLFSNIFSFTNLYDSQNYFHQNFLFEIQCNLTTIEIIDIRKKERKISNTFLI